MEELKYRREDETKDSGIEWLGKIPNEWEVSTLGKVSLIQTGNTPSMQGEENYYENGEVLWVKPDNLNSFNPIDDTKERINDLGIPKARIVPPCTPLVCCIGSIGKFGYSQQSVAYNQQINSVRFDENRINWKYGLYYLSTQEAQHWYYSTGNVVSILNSQNQKQIVIPKLTLIEQQKIANFLDIKTSQFDSIISKKEKLIEKLEEAKKSFISEVVTGKVKIVDGQMVERKPEEMKDSGVEWIGKIPKDWEITKIKYLLANKEDRIKIGPFGSNLKLSEMKEEYKYKVYGQENLIKEDFSLGTRYINHNKFQEMKKYELLEGDIIISMMGTIGKSKVVPRGITSGIMDSHLIRIRVNYEIANRYFLNFLIREGWYIKEQLKKMNNGSIMSGLNSTIIKNLYVAKPTIEEQNMMLYYFNNKIAKLNNIINKTKTQIQKLKEAKQSLISEAVTGKIDLRDWEIREVDEF